MLNFFSPSILTAPLAYIYDVMLLLKSNTFTIKACQERGRDYAC